ncbi:MAG: hypothetical protein KKI08_12875 [Armatimonadetes bacterium]|nr:hypothetical protein [Armatimonadota bacterium]
MTEAKQPRPRWLRRLPWVLPILLVLAVAANWSDISKIVRGERSFRSIIYGRNEDLSSSISGWTMPSDTGAADAKVTIEIFLIAGDSCHIDSACLGHSLGTLDPKRMRIKFVNSVPGSAGSERSQQLKLGCDQGLAINGKTKFTLPDPAKPGKQKTVLTSHNGGGLDTPALYALLDRALKDAYKGKGLGMTQEEFAARLQEASEQFVAQAEADAKARAEAEKAKK